MLDIAGAYLIMPMAERLYIANSLRGGSNECRPSMKWTERDRDGRRVERGHHRAGFDRNAASEGGAERNREPRERGAIEFNPRCDTCAIVIGTSELFSKGSVEAVHSLSAEVHHEEGPP